MAALEKIQNKWMAEQKIYFPDVLTIPSGERVAGRYVVAPSGKDKE